MHRLGLVRRNEAILPVEFSLSSGPVLREFRIKEQTPVEMVAHYEVYEKAREDVIEELKGLEADSKQAMDLYCGILLPCAQAILSDPVDELPPPSCDDMRSLTYAQLVEIVNAQEKLTHLEEHLGNAHRLLAEAKVKKAQSEVSALASSKRAPKSQAKGGRRTRSTP